MKNADGNPPRNALPPGITDDALAHAVEASGYPLQLAVASLLTKLFTVTEEWAFIDRVTGDVRTLDLFAYRQLRAQQDEADSVFPALALLIECKRSQMPFVFFKAVSEPWRFDFPAILALRETTFDLDAGDIKIRFPIPHVIGVSGEPFATEAVNLCATFSKVTRKGKELELSGSDIFNGIVLPLISSIEHYHVQNRPTKPQSMYFPTLVLAICAIEAPMIMVDVASGESSLQPWVRVVRNEVHGKLASQYGIDFVHIDYFETFLHEHLLPFAAIFRERLRGKFQILDSMAVAVPSLAGWTWRDVRPRDA